MVQSFVRDFNMFEGSKTGSQLVNGLPGRYIGIRRIVERIHRNHGFMGIQLCRYVVIDYRNQFAEKSFFTLSVATCKLQPKFHSLFNVVLVKFFGC